MGALVTNINQEVSLGRDSDIKGNGVANRQARAKSKLDKELTDTSIGTSLVKILSRICGMAFRLTYHRWKITWKCRHTSSWSRFKRDEAKFAYCKVSGISCPFLFAHMRCKL